MQLRLKAQTVGGGNKKDTHSMLFRYRLTNEEQSRTRAQFSQHSRAAVSLLPMNRL